MLGIKYRRIRMNQKINRTSYIMKTHTLVMKNSFLLGENFFDSLSKIMELLFHEQSNRNVAASNGHS